MERNPIDIYNEAIKNNKLDILIEKLKVDEDLLYSFLEEAFYSVDSNFLEICRVTSNYYLSKKFDDELIKNDLFQNSDFRKTIYNRIFLLEVGLSSNISKDNQLRDIKELVNLANDPDMLIGIHRTGGQFGKMIMDEGLLLTGHLSSGAPNNININVSSDKLIDDLERNISFIGNGAMLVQNIVTGGTYKMGAFFDDADVVVVGINKNDLDGNKILKEDVIQGQYMLKPEYIIGYVNVDNNHRNINNFVKNPLYKYLSSMDYDDYLDVSNFIKNSVKYMDDKYDGSGFSRIKNYLVTGNSRFLTKDNGIRNGISTLDKDILMDFVQNNEKNSHHKK